MNSPTDLDHESRRLVKRVNLNDKSFRPPKRLRASESEIRRLEEKIDRLTASLDTVATQVKQDRQEVNDLFIELLNELSRKL